MIEEKLPSQKKNKYIGGKYGKKKDKLSVHGPYHIGYLIINIDIFLCRNKGQ